jgi:hypothetical protein
MTAAVGPVGDGWPAHDMTASEVMAVMVVNMLFIVSSSVVC